MQIPSTSQIRLFLPVWPPVGTDPTVYPVFVALIPDEGDEPEDADWVAGEWAGTKGAWEASLLPPAPWGDLYPDGQYVAWVRIDARVGTGERPDLKAGRVRIGELS